VVASDVIQTPANRSFPESIWQLSCHARSLVECAPYQIAS
jgi:hypothetical protein